MKYIHNETNEVKTKAQWKADNKNISFPATWDNNVLEMLNLSVVHISSPPINNDVTKEVVFKGVVFNSETSRHEETWVIQNRYETEDEKEQIYAMEKTNRINEMKKQRDKDLSDTDWVVIRAKETGTEVPEKYLDYRSKLRDITKHENWPFLDEEDWPTKPF